MSLGLIAIALMLWCVITAVIRGCIDVTDSHKITSFADDCTPVSWLMNHVVSKSCSISELSEGVIYYRRNTDDRRRIEGISNFFFVNLFTGKFSPCTNGNKCSTIKELIDHKTKKARFRKVDELIYSIENIPYGILPSNVQTSSIDWRVYMALKNSKL